MHLDFLGDSFAIIDTPGSAAFQADGALTVAAADLAVVTVDSDTARATSPSPRFASSRRWAFRTSSSSTRSTRREESIRKTVTQPGRHKKPSGRHRQFGDVAIEVSPLPRAAGFEFHDRISGGVVPRQWTRAVEQGVRDALAKGLLGVPVPDVAVTLVDGSYHSVDSSGIAFRTAGRIAMAEAPAASPICSSPCTR
jgi:translation elongation factor EF-G